MISAGYEHAFFYFGIFHSVLSIRTWKKLKQRLLYGETYPLNRAYQDPFRSPLRQCQIGLPLYSSFAFSWDPCCWRGKERWPAGSEYRFDWFCHSWRYHWAQTHRPRGKLVATGSADWKERSLGRVTLWWLVDRFPLSRKEWKRRRVSLWSSNAAQTSTELWECCEGIQSGMKCLRKTKNK